MVVSYNNNTYKTTYQVGIIISFYSQLTISTKGNGKMNLVPLAIVSFSRNRMSPLNPQGKTKK